MSRDEENSCGALDKWTNGFVISNERDSKLQRAPVGIRRECHCYTALATHLAGPCTISRSRVIEIENRRVEMILAKRDERATTGSRPVHGSL